MSDSWGEAFLAVAAFLGEAPGEVAALLPEPVRQSCAALLHALGEKGSEARARAMSAPLALVVRDLESMRLP